MKPVAAVTTLLLLTSPILFGQLLPATTAYQKSLDERRKEFNYKRIRKVTKVAVFSSKVQGPEYHLVVWADGEGKKGCQDPWLFPLSWDLKDGVLELEFVAFDGQLGGDKSSMPISAVFKIESPTAALKLIKVYSASNCEELHVAVKLPAPK